MKTSITDKLKTNSIFQQVRDAKNGGKPNCQVKNECIFFTEKKRFFKKLILKSFVYIHIDAYKYMQGCSIVFERRGQTRPKYIDKKKKANKRRENWATSHNPQNHNPIGELYVYLFL